MIGWVLGFGAVGGTLLGIRWMGHHAGRAEWYAAGKALELPVVHAHGSRWTMSGPVGDFQLEISTTGQNNKLRTLVILRGGLPTNLELRPETSLDQLFSGADFQLDDPPFDTAVRIAGDEATALAVLDANTRKRLITLARSGLRLESGELVVRLDSPMSAAASILPLVREMHRLAKGLNLRERPLSLRLAQSLRTDPVASVRRRCLEAWTPLDFDPALRTSLLRAARKDPDPGVQLVAAKASGAEGHPTLRALIEQPIAAELRESALTQLGVEAPDQLRELLPRWIDEPALRSSVARWAVRLELGAIIDAVSEPTLPAAVALDVVEAQHARARSPALVALLAHSDRDVQLAVIEALAEVGERAALPALRALSTGALTSGVIKQRARAALAAITQRVGGAAGGLALSEVPLGGTLALTEEA